MKVASPISVWKSLEKNLKISSGKTTDYSWTIKKKKEQKPPLGKQSQKLMVQKFAFVHTK